MRRTIATAALSTVLMIPCYAGAADVCGDINDSGEVTTSDALALLKKAVGQNVTLLCPPPSRPMKTTQTNCYNDAGGVISCGNVLVGFSGQDAGQGWGVPRSYTTNSDATITDNVTGLMWEQLSDNGTPDHDHDIVFTFALAFDKIARLNGKGADPAFAGYTDWRLPNVIELESLRNFGITGGEDAAFFSPCSNNCALGTCSCTQFGEYWSSTSSTGDPTKAWAIEFAFANESALPKTEAHHVRAVRNGL